MMGEKKSIHNLRLYSFQVVWNPNDHIISKISHASIYYSDPVNGATTIWEGHPSMFTNHYPLNSEIRASQKSKEGHLLDLNLLTVITDSLNISWRLLQYMLHSPKSNPSTRLPYAKTTHDRPRLGQWSYLQFFRRIFAELMHSSIWHLTCFIDATIAALSNPVSLMMMTMTMTCFGRNQPGQSVHIAIITFRVGYIVVGGMVGYRNHYN